MTKRIVYIIKQAMSQRNFDRFGLEFFISRNVEVSVVDVGPYYLPDWHQDRSMYDSYGGIEFSVIAGRQEFGKLRDALRNADLVLYLAASQHHSRKDRPLLKAVTDAGVPYVISMANSVPGTIPSDRHQSYLTRLLATLRRLPEIDPINSIAARLPLSSFGAKPADAVIFAGRKSRGRSTMMGANTQIIDARAMDYDIYLKIRDLPQSGDSFAIFLDQNRPFSSDPIEYRARNSVDPNLYFTRLARLFDRIESELGLEVKIAVHPRAAYAGDASLFRGREMISGKTAELVRDSRLVVAHTSVAVNFAVLFRKPTLIVATEDMLELQVWHRLWHLRMAHALGLELQMFDDPDQVELSDALNLDGDAYDEYERDYICDVPLPEKPFWHLVTDQLSDLRIVDL